VRERSNGTQQRRQHLDTRTKGVPQILPEQVRTGSQVEPSLFLPVMASSPMASSRRRVSARCTASPTSNLVFAVATVTRKPHKFDKWIAYYKSLGAARLFICVEETPEAVAICEQWPDFVSIRHSNAQVNPYETIIDRQEVHVNWSLGECERLGIEWLVHCDDDELLFLGAPFAEIAAQCPEDVSCIMIENIEGVPRDESSDFTSINTFCTDDDGFLAYVNGKSAGRVGHCSAHGCHRFTGAEWTPAKEDMCILHFESCPYTRWHDKFGHYARKTKPTRHTNVPFEFYVDSITAFREAEMSTDGADEVAARLRAFWHRRKRRHYSRFAERWDPLAPLARRHSQLAAPSCPLTPLTHALRAASRH
jgi:hypothetical protein